LEGRRKGIRKKKKALAISKGNPGRRGIKKVARRSTLI